MKRALWLLLAAGLLAGTGYAQVPIGPGNSPPEFRIVSDVDPTNGNIVFLQQRIVKKMIPKTITEKVIVNGKEQAVTKTIYENVPVQEMITEVWSSKKDKAYDGEGFPLPVEKVLQLKKGDAVIITRNQKLEQSFERLLNKKAVVLLIVDQK